MLSPLQLPHFKSSLLALAASLTLFACGEVPIESQSAVTALDVVPESATESEFDISGEPAVSIAPVDSTRTTLALDVWIALRESPGLDRGHIKSLVLDTKGEQGAVLRIIVEANSASELDVIEAQWEAELALGAVAETSPSSEAAMNAVIRTMSVAIVDLNGRLISSADRPVGQMALGQHFSGAPSRDVVEKSLSELGIGVASYETIKNIDEVLQVEATIADPSVLKGRLEEVASAVYGNPASVESFLFDLSDSSGNVVVRFAVNFRTGMGTEWITPAYAELLRDRA